MDIIPVILFYLWVAAMMVACWAVEAARMFRHRILKDAERLLPDLKTYPTVAVILPIKGIDEDTEENIAALLHQDYPAARFLFAVESLDDPAIHPLTEFASTQPPGRVEIIIAGLSADRGQKIHNQLAAVARTSAADDILVFMDADARPQPQWLKRLTLPLADDTVGATTGYRLYVPTPAPHTSLTPSAMASVINATVAALLGPPNRNLAWGGSMAIRRTNFFTFGIHDAWQHAVSDDYVLSYCVKRRAKKGIHFVPHCLVSSSAAFDWPAFFEFASRQYRITKVCAPWIWLTALSGELLYAVAFAYPLLLWIIRILNGRQDNPLLLMFTAFYIANIIRGHLLYTGALAALPAEAKPLRRVRFWYTLGYPLAIFANLLALLRSAFGRTINWRNVEYTMLSRTQTQVARKITAPPPNQPITPSTNRLEAVCEK